jgi:alkylation response protein AidB-like acyl-CoA dehydrogenase
MGEEEKGSLYITCIERLIMAINGHARAEYAIEYTIEYTCRSEKVDKFQALRHTIVEHATEVEHCKVFNYCRSQIR